MAASSPPVLVGVQLSWSIHKRRRSARIVLPLAGGLTRRIDVALHAVIGQAWVEGVSTGKVDYLVAAFGVESGISKSEVSRICGQLDADVGAWRGRDLGAQAVPYVFLDATYCKARVGGRVVSRAVVMATGVTADGRREVLGVDVGDSETEDFWTEFLRGLRDRPTPTAAWSTPSAPSARVRVVATLPGPLHARTAGPYSTSRQVIAGLRSVRRGR